MVNIRAVGTASTIMEVTHTYLKRIHCANMKCKYSVCGGVPCPVAMNMYYLNDSNNGWYCADCVRKWRLLW